MKRPYKILFCPICWQRVGQFHTENKQKEAITYCTTCDVTIKYDIPTRKTRIIGTYDRASSSGVRF